jgi:hypothetical protein
MPSSFCRTAFAAACTIIFSCTVQAEPLPMPKIDYAAKAKMIGGMTVASRHADGKMRMDTSAPGVPVPMTAYIDLRTRKVVTVMTVPGMSAMAMETDIGSGGEGPPIAVGEGKRVGTAAVAGEACELWQVEGKSSVERSMNAVACISSDGIPLRLEATIEGKREIVFEVTEITRGPQDVKSMIPPANLKKMQIPAGMLPGKK